MTLRLWGFTDLVISLDTIQYFLKYKNMIDQDAIEAFSALAQEHRLNVFRLLVREGPKGLAAGEISKKIGISPSSLSFHLAHLERSGLVSSRRDQRHIFYTADYTAMKNLLAFLTDDCCHGHPEICGDLTIRNATETSERVSI